MAERRVLEVCPSCFSTRHEVRGYAPDLSEKPMAGVMDWPQCRDPWHEEKRDGLKVAFDQYHYVQETGEFRPGAPEGDQERKPDLVIERLVSKKRGTQLYIRSAERGSGWMAGYPVYAGGEIFRCFALPVPGKKLT